MITCFFEKILPTAIFFEINVYILALPTSKQEISCFIILSNASRIFIIIIFLFYVVA